MELAEVDIDDRAARGPKALQRPNCEPDNLAFGTDRLSMTCSIKFVVTLSARPPLAVNPPWTIRTREKKGGIIRKTPSAPVSVAAIALRIQKGIISGPDDLSVEKTPWSACIEK
jgi:hypothetical protein